MNNPKRIPEFPSLYNGTPLWTDRTTEGLEGMAPAPATPLAKESIESLMKKRKQDFLNAKKAQAPSAAKKMMDKMTVNNVNAEVNYLLDSLDSLSTTDVTKMFDFEADTTMNQMGPSDLDTKKVMTQVTSAITQVSNIFRAIMKKGSLLARLSVKKTQSFMMSWNDNVNNGCRKIANALTNDHATEYEVQVFVDQTQKFCMAFLIWMFVMNWYFVTYFVKENERYSFDVSYLKNFSITLYAFFGPSYRALQCFNWALVEVPSMLRYTLSKPVIFCIMLVIFTALVQSNFHTTILTDFFNSMEGRYSTSIFCVFSILIVLAYSLWFVAVESGWHQWMNVFKNIPGTVAYFFIVLIYLIVVCVVGIPMAMFFVSAFFVFYSFLGVFIYRGSDTANTFVRISEDISNLSEVVEDEYDSKFGKQPFDFLKMPVYIWNAFYKTLRVAYGYAFELVLLFMLLSGISKYRSAFHKVIASKLNANQTFSKNGPIADAFKNLFSWLLIINILLIIIIVVWMVRKWNTIQMLKCDTNMAKPSFNLMGMIKRAKDFVGENVTKAVQSGLEKRGAMKTGEEKQMDEQQDALLQKARANPADADLQRQASEILAERKETWDESKASAKEKWLTRDAWRPEFSKSKGGGTEPSQGGSTEPSQPFSPGSSQNPGSLQQPGPEQSSNQGVRSPPQIPLGGVDMLSGAANTGMPSLASSILQNPK